MPSFNLGFIWRKDPARVGQINVTNFNTNQLLRPCASLPGGNDEVLESLARYLRQDRLVLSWCKELLSPARRWFLHVLHRVRIDQPKSAGPAIGSLYGSDRVVLIRARPVRMARGPAQYVVGSQLL